MSLPFPLLGNETLRRQCAGRLGHALILSGMPGTGHHTAARYIAMLQQCTGEGTRPCGVCPHCRKLLKGVHPDLTIVPRLLPNGKAFSTEAARTLREDMYIRPNEGSCKVYLFEEAGELKPEVQNILLKVVEDGPDYLRFLFLTEHAARLLPTIRSRCEELKLSPLPAETVRQRLAELRPEETADRLASAAEQSEGSVGRALALLEQEEPEGVELSDRLCRALLRRDPLELTALLAEVDRTKLERADLLESLRLTRERLLAALLLSSGAKHTEPPVVRSLTALPPAVLKRLAEETEEAVRRLEGSGGAGHVMGRLIVKWSEVLGL